jgi:hypothetical protein
MYRRSEVSPLKKGQSNEMKFSSDPRLCVLFTVFGVSGPSFGSGQPKDALYRNLLRHSVRSVLCSKGSAAQDIHKF